MTTMSMEKRSRNNTYFRASLLSPQYDPSWMKFSTNFKSSPKPKIRRSKSILKNSPRKKSKPPSKSRWNTRWWWICWRASPILRRKSNPSKKRSARMNKKCNQKWMKPRQRGHKKSRISIISSQVRYVLILKVYVMVWESGGSYVPNNSRLQWKQRQYRNNPQMKIKSMVSMRWPVNIKASIESQPGTLESLPKELKSRRHRIQNEPSHHFIHIIS